MGVNGMATNKERAPMETPVATPERGFHYMDIVDAGSMVMREVEEILRAGRASKVRIKLGSKVLAELPVALTAAGALAVAIGAVVLSRLTVELVPEARTPPSASNGGK
jgi:hypothetical protein